MMCLARQCIHCSIGMLGRAESDFWNRSGVCGLSFAGCVHPSGGTLTVDHFVRKLREEA
jgi:hypothetical protein